MPPVNVRVHSKLCLPKIVRNYCTGTNNFLQEIFISFLKTICQIKPVDLLSLLTPLVCLSIDRLLSYSIVINKDEKFLKWCELSSFSFLNFSLIVKTKCNNYVITLKLYFTNRILEILHIYTFVCV